MLTFRDSNKSFNLDGDLLKTMTNYTFIVGHSNPQDQKLIYEFGKEMNLSVKQVGVKNPKDETFIKLLNSGAIVASGFSTIFLSSDPDEICDGLNLLLQEKEEGNDSYVINEEIVAIVIKLLEYKCISKKQQKQLLFKCNLLHTKKK